jgi:hypothetical protein
VTCAELQRDAAGLAALAPGDPQRDAAFEHARSCPGCAEALRAGERLLALLDALPPESAPSSAALRRAAEPVLQVLPPVRPGVALPAVVAAAALLVVAAARSTSGAPRDWIAAAALAVAAAGVAALSPRLASAAPAAVALSLLAALAGGGPGPLAVGEGIQCAAIELAAASVTSLAALALWRGDGPAPARLAAAAAAGALAAQGALEVSCLARDGAAHLLAFHVGAVALSALAGAAIGARQLRVASAQRAPPA